MIILLVSIKILNFITSYYILVRNFVCVIKTVKNIVNNFVANCISSCIIVAFLKVKEVD